MENITEYERQVMDLAITSCVVEDCPRLGIWDGFCSIHVSDYAEELNETN